MRFLKQHDIIQRGCKICDDVRNLVDQYNRSHFTCPHAECPYSVLDKYETYDDFLKSKDSQILVPEFFDSVASCYSMSTSGSMPRKMFYHAQNISSF